jgi:hypothetical protein
MTEVNEEIKATAESDAPVPATSDGAEGAPADSTPVVKTPKSWADRIKTSLENGRQNARYIKFKEFIADESNGETVADLDTIALVMTLINGWRATPEYKEWDAEYRATTGGGTTPKDVKPKTKEEAQALVKKAEESAARQAKAKATAEARAERARLMLAELEQEAAGEGVEADESDEDITDDTGDADDSTDEAF